MEDDDINPLEEVEVPDFYPPVQTKEKICFLEE